MQLTYHFLAFIFEPLNEFNTMFQAGDSLVGYLHAEMERLLKMFQVKFVKMSTISATDHVTQVGFKNPSSQHDNDLLLIGMGARRFIADNSDSISPTQLATFFRNICCKTNCVLLFDKHSIKFHL
ncbi:uncharacterized protein LOC123562814 [Mercenaria mercenaria]|uniref:uncharacterized protein LOC123562814 n=1 Tax=Mercenaria mercenaria TaxID=6596 RepID=UPI00234ECCCE|nr:uncharacterized protein LOC123562814 [Mercenaria mercenaria]